MLITTDYLRDVIEFDDVDTSDQYEIDYVKDSVEQVAAAAVAEVDVIVISAENGTVLIEVSGYYAEFGAFMRRWEDR